MTASQPVSARPIAVLAQRLFWAWAAAVGVAAFGVVWMQTRGWWGALVSGDPSGISCLLYTSDAADE